MNLVEAFLNGNVENNVDDYYLRWNIFKRNES